MNVVKGSIYGIIGFFFMAVFGLLTKAALQSGSVYWVSFIAYLTGTVALAPFFSRFSLLSEHYGLLLGRALFGTFASFCYTLSIHYIPIVNGTLLFNTAPLFIPILATFFLKAKIARSTWAAVLIGFLGVVIIIKPTEALFTQAGNMIGVISGLSLAIAYLLMKQLTATDPGVRIIFYYLGIGTLVQIPLLFIDQTGYPDIRCIEFSIFAGGALLLAQLALVVGYKYAEASQIGIYQYLSVVFVGLFDWMIWGAVPSMAEICGALLVACAGMLIIRSGSARQIKNSAP